MCTIRVFRRFPVMMRGIDDLAKDLGRRLRSLVWRLHCLTSLATRYLREFIVRLSLVAPQCTRSRSRSRQSRLRRQSWTGFSSRGSCHPPSKTAMSSSLNSDTFLGGFRRRMPTWKPGSGFRWQKGFKKRMALSTSSRCGSVSCKREVRCVGRRQHGSSFYGNCARKDLHSRIWASVLASPEETSAFILVAIIDCIRVYQLAKPLGLTCLCFGFFEHRIYTLPFRLTTEQPSQSRFTEERTFIPRASCGRLIVAGATPLMAGG